MRSQLQSKAIDLLAPNQFWGLGRVLALSCLLQIILFAMTGFWGVIYLALIALMIMWFCTTFRAVEQPELQGTLESSPRAM